MCYIFCARLFMHNEQIVHISCNVCISWMFSKAESIAGEPSFDYHTAQNLMYRRSFIHSLNQYVYICTCPAFDFAWKCFEVCTISIEASFFFSLSYFNGQKMDAILVRSSNEEPLRWATFSLVCFFTVLFFFVFYENWKFFWIEWNAEVKRNENNWKLRLLINPTDFPIVVNMNICGGALFKQVFICYNEPSFDDFHLFTNTNESRLVFRNPFNQHKFSVYCAANFICMRRFAPLSILYKEIAKMFFNRKWFMFAVLCDKMDLR